jgi:hypothetical protein
MSFEGLQQYFVVLRGFGGTAIAIHTKQPLAKGFKTSIGSL